MSSSRKIKWEILKMNPMRSDFDEVLRGIAPTAIPLKYVSLLVIHFKNGKIIELTGTELSASLPVNDNTVNDGVADQSKFITDIKVYVDTDLLEKDTIEATDEFFRKCINAAGES